MKKIVETALHKGSRVGHAQVAEVVLRNGARQNQENRRAETSLHIACVFGRKAVHGNHLISYKRINVQKLLFTLRACLDVKLCMEIT